MCSGRNPSKINGSMPAGLAVGFLPLPGQQRGQDVTPNSFVPQMTFFKGSKTKSLGEELRGT
jgi:hypothetical protein